LLQGFDYAIKAGYVRHLQLLRIVPVVSAVPIVPVVAIRRLGSNVFERCRED